MPELLAAMLAVDAELGISGPGSPLLIESLGTMLCVHLLRHVTQSASTTDCRRWYTFAPETSQRNRLPVSDDFSRPPYSKYPRS
jgi:hypothetical protein